MFERIDPVAYDAGRFLADLRTGATILGAPFEEPIVRRTLSVFDDEFRSCVVQTKATSRAGDGLYYRMFYKGEKDLTEVARRSGLLGPAGGPIDALQHEVLEKFPGATRAGLDFDTGHGLAKVWTFTGGPTPIGEVLALESIPDSVRAHAGFFARAGLDRVFFVASDHQRDSMNVYFGLEPACRTEDWLRALIAGTGGAPPEPALVGRAVEALAVSAGIGTTFRWDGREMGRWCLYGLAVPYLDPRASAGLPPLPPRLAGWCEGMPTLNRTPQINVAWSFGRAGFYAKLEKSYARDADRFLTVEMGGDLSHPEAAGVGPSAGSPAR